MTVYTFILTAQDVETIGAGLRELPYRVSAGLLERLKFECARQEHEAAEKAKAMDAEPVQEAA